jgi:hypothetical protein
MTSNIIDIYQRLYIASDNIKGETIDYNRGFQDAVYLLKMALQKHEHINMHIENKKIRRQLFLANLALDDKYEDRHILKSKIVDLENKVSGLNGNVTGLLRKKEAEIKKCVMGERLRDVEIDFETTSIKFAINADKETFDLHFQDAVNYVYLKRDRKTKRVSETIIRNWFMQFYRDKGFKLVTL